MNRKKIKLFIIFVVTSLLALIFASPLYFIFVNSFKPELDANLNDILTETIKLPSVWTPKYIIEGYKTVNFTQAFFVSLLITVTSVSIIIIISAMAAWVLVRVKTKTSTVLFFFLIASMLIPFQSLMFPLVKFMSFLGFDNVGGLIFMYAGFGVSLSTFLFHGFIKGIPISLEEAGYLDGCNSIQLFILIILPLLKPIIITAAVLNVIWIWNDFLLPYLILQDIQTIPLAMQNLSKTYSIRWDLYMPVVLLSIIPVLAFYFFAQKHIIKGITAGANK
ncbi:MAG: sugar ABC transporter permease [Firmicutes bacterium HGW-Firmicutes-7]|nr:MAG: sugar ABC transporter permease [Firmicutes bacterium HGW-Firmicutes-7]